MFPGIEKKCKPSRCKSPFGLKKTNLKAQTQIFVIIFVA